MPVQIGSTSPSFSEPARLLSDCHRRVEMFLGTLTAVAGRQQELDGDTSRALENALRYFRLAAPKHTADEEESLFPRLRQVRTSEVQAVMAELDRLEADHRRATPLHDEVEQLGSLWLSEGRLPAAELERFRAAVAQLEAMYRKHIEFEDQVVFPLAERVLSREELLAVGKEMAERRQVNLADQARIVTQLSADV